MKIVDMAEWRRVSGGGQGHPAQSIESVLGSLMETSSLLLDSADVLVTNLLIIKDLLAKQEASGPSEALRQHLDATLKNMAIMLGSLSFKVMGANLFSEKREPDATSADSR